MASTTTHPSILVWNKLEVFYIAAASFCVRNGLLRVVTPRDQHAFMVTSHACRIRALDPGPHSSLYDVSAHVHLGECLCAGRIRFPDRSRDSEQWHRLSCILVDGRLDAVMSLDGHIAQKGCGQVSHPHKHRSLLLLCPTVRERGSVNCVPGTPGHNCGRFHSDSDQMAVSVGPCHALRRRF